MKKFKLLFLAIVILLGFTGCEKKDPTEMHGVHWDRDMCVRCKMVVSDRHHAVQVINTVNGIEVIRLQHKIQDQLPILGIRKIFHNVLQRCDSSPVMPCFIILNADFNGLLLQLSAQLIYDPVAAIYAVAIRKHVNKQLHFLHRLVGVRLIEAEAGRIEVIAISIHVHAFFSPVA